MIYQFLRYFAMLIIGTCIIVCGVVFITLPSIVFFMFQITDIFMYAAMQIIWTFSIMAAMLAYVDMRYETA